MQEQTKTTIEIVLDTWPSIRDGQVSNDISLLDQLLSLFGEKNAFGVEQGIDSTFSGFADEDNQRIVLPSGEFTSTPNEAKLLAHILITRLLVAAGLHVDRRVQGALGDAYANTWCVKGEYITTPLVLAHSLWLIALDPQNHSDIPLAINWDPTYYQNSGAWNLGYRLFSHYDVKERALDWAVHVSQSPDRYVGCSRWNIVEPLIRINDERAHLAIKQLSDTVDKEIEGIGAAEILERSRIFGLLERNSK